MLPGTLRSARHAHAHETLRRSGHIHRVTHLHRPHPGRGAVAADVAGAGEGRAVLRFLLSSELELTQQPFQHGLLVIESRTADLGEEVNAIGLRGLCLRGFGSLSLTA